MSVRRPPIATRLRTRLLKASQGVESALSQRKLRHSPGPLVEEAIAALRTEGVWVTTVERLLGAAAPACRETMAAAAALLARRDADDDIRWRKSTASTDLAHGELLARLPGLFMFGLQAPLLAIAQHYLRVPVAYHGAVLRHSLVDGRQVGPRRWHRDAEDFHVLRTVLYLNDVTEEGGPFEYVPRPLQAAGNRALSDDGMCTNDEMAAEVPRELWKRCVGPAGTVVIADSAQVFHHESLQRGAERSVVMMGHSSRRPRDAELAKAHFPAHRHRAALARLVPPELQPHVFGWRELEVPATGHTDPTTTVLGDFLAN